MARGASKGKIVPKPAEIPETPPPAPEDSDFTDALAAIKGLGAQDGIEWSIKVYQVMGGAGRSGGPQPYLFSITLDELATLEDTLSETYPGGGRFRVMCRADGRVVKAALLEIAPRPGYKPPPPSWATPPAQQPSAQGSSADGTNAAVLTMLQTMQQENRTFMLAIAEKFSAPPPNPAATLDGMLGMLAKVQDLIPKAATEAPLAMFEKGMDFAMKAATLAGGDKGETGLLDLIRSAIETPGVQKAIGAMATLATQPPPGSAPAPAMVENHAPPSQQGQGGEFRVAGLPFVNPQNREAANAIEMLIGQAMAGTDPKLVADQAFHMLPPAVIEELEQQDDVLGYIERAFPNITPHRVWFSQLIENMWEPDQGAPPPAGSPFLNARPVESTKPSV